jgi:hypothetical protein
LLPGHLLSEIALEAGALPRRSRRRLAIAGRLKPARPVSPFRLRRSSGRRAKFVFKNDHGKLVVAFFTNGGPPGKFRRHDVNRAAVFTSRFYFHQNTSYGSVDKSGYFYYTLFFTRATIEFLNWFQTNMRLRTMDAPVIMKRISDLRLQGTAKDASDF